MCMGVLKMFDFVKYRRESKDKIIYVYRSIDDLHKIGHGEMYFRNHIFSFTSGGAGKGYAPPGPYKIYQIIPETRSGFVQFNFGWQAPFEAQFKTDRWGLAAHPNGNGEETLGCPACNFSSLDENVLCHNLIRDWLDIHGFLNVDIIKCF